MPRDGSNIYHRPPGTDAITNTTVASAPYNSNVADVEQDLNIPRPIVAGGTGANNADAALVPLGAEKAHQLVTNYASVAFVSGSFESNGATSDPVSPVAGHIFVGNAVVNVTNQWVTLVAHDLTDSTVPGRSYIREKKAGVWGAWTQDGSGSFVELAGDTMTGPLSLQYSSSNAVTFSLTNTYAGAHAWTLASSGGGPGPAGSLVFYDNTSGGPLVAVQGGSGHVSTQGTFTAGSVGTVGTYFFGNSGTKYLTYDSSNFSFSGGSLTVAPNITATANVFAGTNMVLGNGAAHGASQLYFGSDLSRYLGVDTGSNFTFQGGTLTVNNTVISAVGRFAFNAAATVAFVFDAGNNMAYSYAG